MGTSNGRVFFKVITNRDSIPSDQYNWIRVGPIQNPPSEGQGTNFDFCIANFQNQELCISKAISYKPNVLQATISQTSYLVSDSTDLKLTVKLSNDVPIDGSVEVALPSGYPTEKTFIALDLNKGKGNLTITNSISSNGCLVTISCSKFLSGISASDPEFYIYLFSLTNPATVKNVSGIEISTKLSNGLRINANNVPASIAATIPSIINFISTPLTQTNTEVNSNFGITITMVLPRCYDSGGTISVFLPKAVLISETNPVTCIFGNGWGSFANGKCTALYGDNSYYILGTVAYPSNNRVELTISNLLMPREVRTLEPIYIVTKEADKTIISTSNPTEQRMMLALTPGIITSFSLTRDSSNTIGAVTQVTAKVSILGTFMRSARIHLDLPKEQIYSPTGMVAGIDYNCKLYSQNDTYLTVECASTWCSLSSCPANTALTLAIDGLQNPSASYPYTLSAKAYVYHYDPPVTDTLYLAYTTTSKFYFQPLQPKVIADFAFTITGSKLAGDQTSYSLTFTTVSKLLVNCLIHLSLPINFTYGNSIQVEGLQSVMEYYSSGSVKNINVTNACQAVQNGGTKMTWKILNVKNAPSTIPVNYKDIIITTKISDSGTLDKGLNINEDVTLAANSLINPKITLTTPILAGSLQSSSIEFTLKNKVPKSNGFFEIVLPTETSIEAKGTNPITCQVQFDLITGPCTVTNSNTILVKMSAITSLTTDYLAESTKVVVSFMYLRSPRMVKPSSNLRIRSYLTTSNGDYDIDKCDQCGTITPTQANSLLNAKVIRNETLINLPVNLKVSFTSYNPIPATGSIVMEIPIQGAIIDDSGIDGVKVISDTIIIGATVSTASQIITITIPQYCGVTGCKENQQLSYEVVGLKNPPVAIQTNFYFKIYTKDKQEEVWYNIDASGNVLATPEISAGQFSSISIMRNLSDTMASPISYTIGFTLTNSIENNEGEIKVFPFTETMIVKDQSNPNLQCSMLQSNSFVTIPCTASLNCIDSLGVCEITTVAMSLQCPGNFCPAGLTRKVVIEGILSSFRTSGQGSFVIKTINTGTDGVVDSGTTDPSALSALLPLPLTVTKAVRSITTVGTSTDLVVSLITGLNYEAGSSIQIKVFIEQFVFQANLACTAAVNGSSFASVSCSKLEQSDNYVVITLADPCSGAKLYCVKGTNIDIKVSGFVNAHSISAKDPNEYLDLEISSKSSGVGLQQSNAKDFTISPQLTEASIKGISVILSENKVGDVTELNIAFTSEIDTFIGDVISLQMNGQLVHKTNLTECYRTTQGMEECECTVEGNTYISKVTFAAETVLSQKNGKLKFSIEDVKNIPYVTPYTGTLQIFINDKNNNLVAKGSFDMSALPTIEAALFSSVNLMRESNMLGSVTNLRLSIILSAELPANSYIDLIIPTEQMLYTGSLICTKGCTLLSNSNQQTSLKITGICPSKCQEKSKVEVNITGFKNPIQGYADPATITIATHINTGETINTDSEVYVMPHLNVPNIVISNFESTVQYTNQITSYSFNMMIPNNVPEGGQLVLVIPSAIMLKIDNSDPKCVVYTTEEDCTFQYSGMYLVKVIFNNIYAKGGFAKKTYRISIQNVKNPLSTVPFIGFMLVTSTVSSSSRFAVNQGSFDFSTFTLLPTPILESSVKRTSTALNAVNSLEVSFVLRNIVPATGIIEIVTPSEYGALQDTTQCLSKDSKRIQCSYSISNEQNPSWTVDLNQFCDSSAGCVSGQTLSFTLTNVVNPVYMISNNCIKSINIITYTSKYYSIDAVISDLCVTPLLDGEKLESVFLGIPLTSAGASTMMFVQFMPLANIDSTQKLILDFSRLQFAGTICKTNTYTQVYTSEEVNKKCSIQSDVVTLENICSPSGCVKNQVVTVKLPFINAPYQNTILGGLGLYTRTTEGRDYAYGKVNLDIEIYPNVLPQVSLGEVSCNTTGTVCNYFNVELTTFNVIPSYSSCKGQAKVDLSNIFDLSKASCTAKIQYGSKLQCQTTTDSAIAFANFNDIPSNSKIFVTIANIQLPLTTKPTQIFIQSLREVSGMMMIIDMNYDLTYAVPSPLPFTKNSITVTRSEALISTPAIYKIDVAFDIALEDEYYIFVEIPKEASFSLIPGVGCAIKGNSLATLPCLVNTTSKGSKITIFCEDNNCGSNQFASLTIPETMAINKNYINVFPKTITISTSMDAIYLVQTNTENITITPPLKPMNLIVEASKDSMYFSHPITLTIIAEFGLPDESGLYIEIPDKLFALNSLPLYCSVGQAVSCTSEGKDYVRSIRLSDVALKAAGPSIEVKIDGLRNSDGNYNDENTKLTISTITSEGYKIAEGKAGSFATLQPIELQQVIIEPTEKDSSILVLIYSPVLITSTAMLRIIVTDSSKVFPNPSVTKFVAVQSNPQLSQNSNVFIVKNLFLNGVYGRGGTIYGFYLNTFLRQPVKAKFEVVGANGNQIAFKEDVLISISASATACKDAAPNIEYSSCVDECSSGYFHYEKRCIKCFDSNCKYCENYLQYSCSVCNSAHYIVNGQCTAQCNAELDTIVSDGIKSSRCAKDDGCSSDCGEKDDACSQSGNYCFYCDKTLLLIPGLGQCLTQCPNGYYKGKAFGTTACVRCHYLCDTCEADRCTKCSELYKRYLDASKGECVTACPANTYKNDATRVCEACNEKCSECYGSADDSCTSCADTYFLIGSACTETCPVGFVGNKNSRKCVEKTLVKDLWLITVILTSLVIAIICICKALFLLRILIVPLNIIEISCALFTAVDTINRIILLSDLWNIKNTWLFTFVCGNFLLNCIFMLLFHAQFFGLFLRTEGQPKSGSILVTIMTVLSFFFGFGFIRILTSGFFTAKLLQPFKRSAEYNLEVNAMGTYVMISNIAQIILYGCCFIVNVIGLSIIGIILDVLLVAIHVWELVTEYAKHQFILNTKTQ